MEPDGSNKQLYNLEADHRETIDRAGEEKKMTVQLTAKLSSWYMKHMKH